MVVRERIFLVVLRTRVFFNFFQRGSRRSYTGIHQYVRRRERITLQYEPLDGNSRAVIRVRFVQNNRSGFSRTLTRVPHGNAKAFIPPFFSEEVIQSSRNVITVADDDEKIVGFLNAIATAFVC